MYQNNRLFVILLSVLCILSCSKPVTEDEIITEPVELEVTALYFSAEQNPVLGDDLIPEEENGIYTGTLRNWGSKTLIASFETNANKVLVNNIEQQSGVTANDFTNAVEYNLIGEEGQTKKISVRINWFDPEVPAITISIDGGAEVTSKDYYLQADLSIDGKGLYPDYSGTTEIKGRGNSTWGMPKKPYRLKLNTKSEILGLPTARNWVLLANYLDPSLICNSVAMKIGQDLEVPYANTTIPVDLTINGTYKGSYVLTQQIEEHDNRVNVGSQGYLLELDTYFDEDYQFYSSSYSLPVMIKSPELDNNSEIAPIKADFEQFESLIKASEFPNNGYGNYFDIDAFAKYILVYFMTGNEEVNHPKSTYMHKAVGGKFTFGPLWDFDWAYGYEAGGGHFSNATRPMFWSGTAKGTVFFKRLFQDPAVQAAFKSHWTNYKTAHLANLLTYIDNYAAWIKASKARDEALWKRGKDFETEVRKMKTYIQARAGYIDSFVAGF